MGILFYILCLKETLPETASRESLERMALTYGLELIHDESDESLRDRIINAMETVRREIERGKNKPSQNRSESSTASEDVK
jgi:hypothetical protein